MSTQPTPKEEKKPATALRDRADEIIREIDRVLEEEKCSGHSRS